MLKKCPCPLCGASATVFYQDRYYHCKICDLIFLHADFHLSLADEKAIYDLHENSPTDLAYRKFLSQLTEPLLERMVAPADVLDFGCGPGPTVSVMLAEAGLSAANYDPLYFPDVSVLDETYNAITATEVFEHLSAPASVMTDLMEILKKPGYLGLMTALHAGKKAFPDWGYKHDPTHITFYSEKTMRWIEKKCALEIAYLTNRVVIFATN